MSAAESTAQRWLRLNAALLALTAGAVHLGQVGVHLEAGWSVAAFFLMVGVIQVAASALLLRPRPRSWFWFGIAGSATVVGIWVTSRTVGLPFELGGGVEPLGVAGALASLVGSRPRRAPHGRATGSGPVAAIRAVRPCHPAAGAESGAAQGHRDAQRGDPRRSAARPSPGDSAAVARAGDDATGGRTGRPAGGAVYRRHGDRLAAGRGAWAAMV